MPDNGLTFIVACATIGHAVIGGIADVMDAEACLDPTLVGTATSKDVTVIRAAINAVNRTPTPSDDLYRPMPQAFLQANHKGEATATLRELPNVMAHGPSSPRGAKWIAA